VNGTVTTWRLRADLGFGATPTALQVIRPLGGDNYTGGGTSAIATPTLTGINAFPTRLPIAIGDYIGLHFMASGPYLAFNDASRILEWFPALENGGPGRPFLVSTAEELLINADIEPTSAFSILKPKPKRGGKLLRITANLPNPGTLAAGDKTAKLAAAAGKGQKPKLLRSASTTLNAPGNAVLVVKATKLARSLLADRGRLRAKLKLAFTPTGGTASTQVRKVKLKP
jgi:hypothetical protein